MWYYEGLFFIAFFCFPSKIFLFSSGKVSILESVGSVVRVAVETSEIQVEVELVPTVELMNCWPKKARWPRLLQRWPSAERARCIKVSTCIDIAMITFSFLSSWSEQSKTIIKSSWPFLNVNWLFKRSKLLLTFQHEFFPPVFEVSFLLDN